MVFAAASGRRRARSLAERIDDELPQTQCAQCGYAGCRPYAEAIATGIAAINQCAPGGAPVISRLARIMNVKPAPLNPAYGAHQPRAVAFIDESACIGCTLCIQACPVDAILGAAKLMHTVIADECTGCELCVAPCPVDCIEMRPPDATMTAPPRSARRRAHRARARYRFRSLRLRREAEERGERLTAKAISRLEEVRCDDGAAARRKQAIIEAAIARARRRLQAAESIEHKP